MVELIQQAIMPYRIKGFCCVEEGGIGCFAMLGVGLYYQV